jgi:hypothetical protein
LDNSRLKTGIDTPLSFESCLNEVLGLLLDIHKFDEASGAVCLAEEEEEEEEPYLL